MVRLSVGTRTFAVLALSGLLVAAATLTGVTTQASAASGTSRIVIGFLPGSKAALAAHLESQIGATTVSAVGDLNARVVTVPSAAVNTVLGALCNQAGVAYAELDPLLTPTATPLAPNDPYFAGGINGQEWGETVDQATYAWSLTTGSTAVTIAIIDSGVASTNPDLSSNLVPGWNVLTNSSNTADTYGHGTEVSGVAVAGTNNYQGVAAYCWSCRLMPIEVYNSGTGALASNVASGITWAVDHDANVISISLAGTTDSSVIDSAVSYALSHNVVVVAAAGDFGSSAPVYPAATPGVISVGASDQTDTLFSYSGYGSWVNVSAPGSQATTVMSGGYGAIGGTSAAAPAVAGIVGLMRSADPTASVAQITSALFSTTDPVKGTRQVQYGRVNTYSALQSLLGLSSAPANIAHPVISGSAIVGQTLSAATGTWTGSPTSYSYQWLTCASSICTPILGGTSQSFVVGTGDVGLSLEVSVTALNSSGSASSTSSQSGVVQSTTTTTTTSTTTTTTVPTSTTTTTTTPTTTTTVPTSTTTTTTPTSTNSKKGGGSGKGNK